MRRGPRLSAKVLASNSEALREATTPRQAFFAPLFTITPSITVRARW